MTLRAQAAYSLTLLVPVFLISACGTALPQSSRTETEAGRHMSTAEVSPPESRQTTIPEVVSSLPLLPEPVPQVEPELYSVVALDVPVRELLFAIARDASINIDIHPSISGQVSLNAIDQSIPQILERLSQQIDLRWSFDNNQRLLIEPDSPYWQIYRVDYVNVTREANTTANVSTSIVNVGGAGGGGSGGSNSSANINQNSTNNFWPSLTQNLVALIRDIDASSDSERAINSVISNPESGIINVRASSRQHEQVRNFLNFVQSRSLTQVLIEATVVEVNLNDRYQAGVDWAALARNSGRLNIIQNTTGANLANPPSTVLTIASNSDNPLEDGVTATVSLLSQFGDLRVLSSPRIMALNNQAAMLRVVDNRVYFTIDVQPAILNSTGGVQTPATYTSNIETVPVGFVMTVTPQISDDDQVTLNVRPTISRIVRFVNDPNPVLADAGVVNSIPEIQIREIESILKVNSGQIAVLGGLMQDSLDNNTSGLPVLSRVPGLGNLFSYRDDTTSKTELIVFIRPVVIRQAALDGDMSRFLDYLPQAGLGGN